ncbi:MAG: transposase [Planctomycetota bacterium]
MIRYPSEKDGLELSEARTSSPRAEQRGHRLVARDGRRMGVEWLPPYAPELNPVEQVWGHTKYADLANYIPGDILELACEVIDSIERTESNETLLRSSVAHARLIL